MPKFQVRFSNGYWKLFDTGRYASAGLFYTKADAEKALARRNAARKAR